MSEVRSWCVEAAASWSQGTFGEILFAAFEDGGGEVGGDGGGVVAEDGHLGDGPLFLLGGSPDLLLCSSWNRCVDRVRERERDTGLSLSISDVRLCRDMQDRI